MRTSFSRAFRWQAAEWQEALRCLSTLAAQELSKGLRIELPYSSDVLHGSQVLKSLVVYDDLMVFSGICCFSSLWVLSLCPFLRDSYLRHPHIFQITNPENNEKPFWIILRDLFLANSCYISMYIYIYIRPYKRHTVFLMALVFLPPTLWCEKTPIPTLVLVKRLRHWGAGVGSRYHQLQHLHECLRETRIKMS